MDTESYVRSLDEDGLVELVRDLAARYPEVARDLTERAAANEPDDSIGWDKQDFRALAGAIYVGDVQAGLRALKGQPLQPVLQLAGDVILAALAARLPDAASLATECLGLLRDRHAEGDEELITQLAAKTEGAPEPLLKAVPVDLEELAREIEGNDYREIYLDLDTGDFYPDEVLTGVERPDPDNDDRWLFIGSQVGSRPGYQDMVGFADSVQDGRLRSRLNRALEGKGAFRRFRDELHQSSPEAVDRWYLFSEERQRGRARSWLADRGLRPAWRSKSAG